MGERWTSQQLLIAYAKRAIADQALCARDDTVRRIELEADVPPFLWDLLCFRSQ